MPIKSPKAGVIEALLVEDGASVVANHPVIKLRVGAGAGAPAAQPAAAQPAAQPATPPPPPPPPQQSQPAAPARPAPADLPEVTPLPKAPASSTPVSQVPVTPFRFDQVAAAPSGTADINKIGGTRAETRVKMSKMRQTVANRLKTAQNTCAMLTTFNEINMG